jgi:hypothetical protein
MRTYPVDSTAGGTVTCRYCDGLSKKVAALNTQVGNAINDADIGFVVIGSRLLAEVGVRQSDGHFRDCPMASFMAEVGRVLPALLKVLNVDPTTGRKRATHSLHARMAAARKQRARANLAAMRTGVRFKRFGAANPGIGTSFPRTRPARPHTET